MYFPCSSYMRGCRLSAAAPDFDIYNRIKAVRSYAPYADYFLFGFPVVLVLLILTLFVLLILLILTLFVLLILLILILLILILLVLVLVMICHYSSPCRTSAEYFLRINIFYRKQSIP